MDRDVRTLPDVTAVAAAAADLVVAREPRTFVLTGGESPLPLYRRLATMDVPWRDMELFFGDERCVPPNHPDSNYGQAAVALLDRIEGARVYRMHGEDCDADGYETELRARFGGQVPAFDLTLLGLGDDGHVASLFPGDTDALEERERWVLHVAHTDHPRLTLTLPVLCASKAVLFIVTGERKRDALRQLLDDGPIPAAQVIADEVIVMADRAAMGD